MDIVPRFPGFYRVRVAPFPLLRLGFGMGFLFPNVADDCPTQKVSLRHLFFPGLHVLQILLGASVSISFPSAWHEELNFRTLPNTNSRNCWTITVLVFIEILNIFQLFTFKSFAHATLRTLLMCVCVCLFAHFYCVCTYMCMITFKEM